MPAGPPLLARREVVAALLAARGAALVVAGLGAPAWDCATAGDEALNFYLWGAMGSAAMVGLGLALAQPARRVAVITGDGEMLMGLSSLATIGAAAPANLGLVVLDNERYGETGMQPTHTAAGIDLAGVAGACGFALTDIITDEGGLAGAAATLFTAAGPAFLLVKVREESPPLVLPPRDGAYLKARFREALLGQA